MTIKNKKGFELLGENTVQLVIALLCIVILIVLGVSLYEFFWGDSGDIKKAEYELKEMNAYLTSITDEKTEREYIVTTINDWWLFSDESGGLCDSNFCLCICKKVDCSGNSKACIATDKFVLIRGENGKEARIVELNLPYELKMNLSKDEMYPFNGGASVKDYWIFVKTITPLFFKFDKEWKWSPDTLNWMDTKTSVVSGGKWKDEEPANPSLELIKFVSKLDGVKSNENNGTVLFNQIGVHKSNGVYIIQK